MTWSRPTANLREAVAKNRATLQLTLADGHVVQLDHHPTMRGDSIVEQTGSSGPAPIFAISDVRTLQTRQLDVGKTLLAIVGIPAAAFAGFVGLIGLACSGGKCD